MEVVFQSVMFCPEPEDDNLIFSLDKVYVVFSWGNGVLVSNESFYLLEAYWIFFLG